MKKTEIIIDFGSQNIRIYKKDAGLVLTESNTVILSNSEGRQVVEYAGNAAVRALMNGSRLQGMQVVEPIKDGVVKQETACVLMLKEFLKRICNKKLLAPAVSAIVLVSCGLLNIEKTNFEEVCVKAGISEVVVVESPIALHALTEQPHSFIVDIGAAKTEIAVVDETGIISGCSINVGGRSVNEAISDYLCDKYKLRVPKQLLEEIKINACSFLDNDLSAIEVEGMGIAEIEPVQARLTAGELKKVAEPVIKKIIEVVESVTMMIPENIAESISKKGFYLSGGTAEISGLDIYLEDKLYFKCNKIADPSTAAVRGATKFFYDRQRLSAMLNIPVIK